jgi:hypothetical protein
VVPPRPDSSQNGGAKKKGQESRLVERIDKLMQESERQRQESERQISKLIDTISALVAKSQKARKK